MPNNNLLATTEQIKNDVAQHLADKNLSENVYSKLQNCRVELAKMNLKKTGENKFTKFKYYELSDFLPSIMQLFNKHKLFSLFSDCGEYCTLQIFNADNTDENMIFTSYNADASVKGATAIQSHGSLLTYQRRYLYMMALEIVEADVLDYGMNANDNTIELIDAKTLASIDKDLSDAKASAEKKKYILSKFNITKFSDLPKNQYDNYYKLINVIANKNLEAEKNAN